MTGVLHYLPTRARGIYLVILRPHPELNRFGQVLGLVAKIGKHRWDGFSLNSIGAADVRALGPRVCTKRRRYLVGEDLYETWNEVSSEQAA